MTQSHSSSKRTLSRIFAICVALLELTCPVAKASSAPFRCRELIDGFFQEKLGTLSDRPLIASSIIQQTVTSGDYSALLSSHRRALFLGAGEVESELFAFAVRNPQIEIVVSDKASVENQLQFLQRWIKKVWPLFLDWSKNPPKSSHEVTTGIYEFLAKVAAKSLAEPNVVPDVADLLPPNLRVLSLDHTQPLPFERESFDLVLMVRGMCDCRVGTVCAGFKTDAESFSAFFSNVTQVLSPDPKSVIYLHGVFNGSFPLSTYEQAIMTLEGQFPVQVSYLVQPPGDGFYGIQIKPRTSVSSSHAVSPLTQGKIRTRVR